MKTATEDASQQGDRLPQRRGPHPVLRPGGREGPQGSPIGRRRSCPLPRDRGRPRELLLARLTPSDASLFIGLPFGPGCRVDPFPTSLRARSVCPPAPPPPQPPAAPA